MLKLIDITKDYVSGDTTVHALRGVSLEFRKSEFVSILGQSGCGKTTLLNIIGGLDHYTNGDLIINSKSTKDFTDRDWDTYRNHSIGFIFQSYNLIPHQTVLSNVELALTLSGVSKEERRKRAIEALETVGLGDQIHKKPNQMSGGQMQRVAIARALVNNPDILLADEPTGALDSETSVQIMELLKEISREKLVIMVTHNPELAAEYSTRIINLLDGRVISDSNPYTKETAHRTEEGVEEVTKESKRAEKKNRKKTSMSFFTAILLSLNNLLTKKGRTFLTSFAGSIGIIGIALILSVSSGVNAYIRSVEESTMSSYPLQINESTMDTMSLLGSLMENNGVENPEKNTIYSNDVMANVMNSVTTGYTKNNLTAFKQFIDGDEVFKNNTTDIRYVYKANLNTYIIQENNKIQPYAPTLSGLPELFSAIGLGGMMGSSSNSSSSFMGGSSAFSPLVGDNDYISSQYDILYGHLPTEKNQVVLIVDSKGQVSDFVLYTLGIRDTQDLKNYITTRLNEDPSDDYTIPPASYTYEQICGYKFKVLPDSEKYKVENGKIVERDSEEIRKYLDSEDSVTLEIVGIMTPTDESSVIGSIGYMDELMTEIIEKSNNSDVVKFQKENEETDLLTGLPFVSPAPDCTIIRTIVQTMMGVEQLEIVRNMTDAQLLDIIKTYLNNDAEGKRILMFFFEDGIAPYGGYDLASILKANPEAGIETGALRAYIDSLNNKSIKSLATTLLDFTAPDNALKIINYMLNDYSSYSPAQAHTYALNEVGCVDFDKPSSILIYPRDFEAKDTIKAKISEYNDGQAKENKIAYTDTVAILMSSVTTIVNAISYVLIAFVAISLVVSSIMIGIITYISVLERTKEIGILRAIGASKRDVSRVFNAETLIVGFAAGVIGILVSLVLIVLINIILVALTGLPDLRAVLPVGGAIALVAISMALTLVAGIFPSRIAATKDPVIALRTE